MNPPSVMDKIKKRAPTSSLSRELHDLPEDGNGGSAPKPTTTIMGKPPLAFYSGGMRPPPIATKKGNVSPFSSGRFDTIPWDDCFDSHMDVRVSDTARFRVFRCNPSNGGEGAGVAFLLLHGASHSSLTWALTAKELKFQDVEVLAVDFRGHGWTDTDAEDDLSAETLSKDVVDVVRAVYAGSPPPLLVVGHSMGGGIATRIAREGMLGASLKGLVVVDVVEGSALAALNSSKAVLAARPQLFEKVDEAVKWNIRSGVIKNLESARVSTVGQLRKRDDGRYGWRADMHKSEPHWRGWFVGLSKSFLDSPCAKLLILAGRDRLDKELIMGQMQGKFQLLIFPDSGHMVPEDQPLKTADALLKFAARFGLIRGQTPRLPNGVALRQ